MFSNLKYIFFTLILLFFTFPQSVFSAPIIKIDSFPSTTISGGEFDINFSMSGLVIDSNYYIKSLGGIDFNEVDTWNSSWLQQNASWSSMPIFASNTEGSASGALKSRFAVTTSAGNKDYKIRIRKNDGTTNYDSDVVSITLSTPSPSPTPTNSPTTAPTQVPTVSPTVKPIPTKSPTTKSTSTPTDKPTEESTFLQPEVLSLSTIESSPVSEIQEKSRSPILAIILITLGVGFLGYGGYLLYNQMHAENQKTP